MEFINMKTGEIVDMPNKEAALKYFAEVEHNDPKWTPTSNEVITHAAYHKMCRENRRR